MPGSAFSALSNFALAAPTRYLSNGAVDALAGSNRDCALNAFHIARYTATAVPAPPCVGGTEDAVVRGGLDGVDDDAGALGELLLPPPPLVGGADVLDVGAVEASVWVFTPVPDVQPANRAMTVE